ncbi:MAG: hypothetical protein QXV17_08455 [Candidatus Micrarchaeaceae archaeon]
MPKSPMLTKDEVEKLKLRMLRALSINARLTFSELGKKVGVGKYVAYKYFHEMVEEYGIKFVPEINVENIWKYELVKLMAHESTKTGIRENIIDKFPDVIGFEEYVIFVKFISGKPEDEEILKAIGDSYIPQFVAKLIGDYDLVVYAIARNFEEINKYIVRTFSNLKKTYVTINTVRITRTFGFFPLRNELIEKFNISETYRKVLLYLNQDGRREFADIARLVKIKPEGITYTLDRLEKTGMLERISYYETKPKNVVTSIITMKITNWPLFFEARDKWFLDITKVIEEKHVEYSFMCDIQSPNGGLIFANFETTTAADNFLNSLNKVLKGVELSHMLITKVLIGALGIRNFDMRYSLQYQILQARNLVPRFDRKEGKIEERPNYVESEEH